MKFKYLYIIILILAIIPFVSATAPVAEFSGNMTSGSPLIPISFTDSSTNSPTRWAWFFGDEIWTKPWVRPNATNSPWSARNLHSSTTLPDGSILLMGGTINGSGAGRLNDTWRSTNNGTTWTLMNASSGWGRRSAFSSITAWDGSVLIMGGYDGTTRFNDTWRSTDNGATWTLINASCEWSGRNGLSSVALSDGSIVIMGGESSTVRLNDVWRSTDNGATWTQLNPSAGWGPRMYFTAARLSNNNIVIVGGFQSTGSVKYNDSWKSTDNGATWTQVNSSVFNLGKYGTTAVVMPDDSIVIMGGREVNDTNNVSRSSDYGATWTTINASAGWTRRSYLSSATIPNGSIVIMGGLDSTGSMKNDTWLFNPVGSSLQNPTHTYLAGNYSVSLQAYNADGYNNTRKSNYINISNPYASFSANVTSGNAPVPVAFTDSSTGYPSTWTWTFGDENYSQPWTQQTASMGWLTNSRLLYSTAVLPDGSIVFMGGYNQAAPTQGYNDTWRSTDNGVTWTLINSSSGWSARGGQVTVTTQNGTIVLMGGGPQNDVMDNQVWASTDKGYTWKMINSSAGWLKRYNGGAVVLPDNSIVIMLGYGGYATKDDIWRSTDSGVTWKQQNATSGMAAYWFGYTTTQSGNILVVGGNGATVRNTVWKSTDKGVTWTNISTITPNFSRRYGHTVTTLLDGSILLMGGYTPEGFNYLNDTYRSTDEGATWVQTNISGGALWEKRRNLLSNTMPDGSVLLIGGYGGTASTYYNDTYRFSATGSSDQNPTHTYTGSGNYTVSLTVFNSTTGSNITTKIGYINVSGLSEPSSDFTSNVTEGSRYPMVVQFNDTSTGSPNTWNWSFGDGRWFNTTNSALKDTTYTYAVANKYTVNLTTNNTIGCSTISKNNYINLTSDVDSNVTSWLHMNGTNGSTTFTDLQGIAWTTNGNAQISTLSYKYGGASGRFDGAGDYISTPSQSANNFSTNDFTIEFWMNVTTVAGVNEHVFSKTNNPRNRGWGMDRTASGAGDSGWDFWMGNDSSGQVFFNAPIQNKTWVHIAIERQSGTIYLYVDGNLTNSSAGFNENYDTLDPLWIGRQSADYYDGYIDEFRISKTARWTSNFTPPYNEYRGTLYTNYPNVNPNSTFRYKTDPSETAYIDNVTNGGTRNRTLQIQNVTNTSYVVGQLLFDPVYCYIKSVQLNLSYYPTGMTLLSYTIDNTNGFVEFNISKPTGFSPGTNRASILDYTIAYVTYSPYTIDPIDDYFVYGTLINETTGYAYPVTNFLGTPVTFGPWNFTANFTANNTTVRIGDPIQFVSTFNGSYPNGWNWTFGDGTFDHTDSPTVIHSYSTSGLKTVSLDEHLQQNESVNNTITKIDYILVGDTPVADFTMTNQTGMIQLIVRLNDTSTNIPTAWNWSVDDGYYQDIQDPVYALTGIGNYSIKLNVSNIFGSSCATQYANISEAPITNFTVNVSNGNVPLAVQFTDDSGYGPIVEWNWSFGDLPGNYSDIPNPVYTFNQGGIYNVTLYTRNIFGTNLTWNYVTVNAIPISEFTISNITGNTPLVVRFNDTSLYSPTSWNWSFGEGNYSDSQDPAYIFNYVGNYTVTLNASNSAGSNCVTHYANATQGAAPIASFIMNNSSSGSPLVVQFNDTSVNSPDAWNWSFGNGVYSEEQNPNYTFVAIGNYTITLNASNSAGSNIATQYAEVFGPPTALFTTNTQIGGEPLAINFTDTSTSNPTAWNWSFNDRTGNNTEIWFSTLQNPNWSFFVGNYTIKLNASNTYGYDITPYDYWINVSVVIAPIADFTSTSTGGPYPPVEVQFNDTSLNFPTQWNWSFGDGNVSALQNPLHNYTFCGNFDVLLRIENSMGVNWSNKTNYVIVQCAPLPPTPDERIATRMADIGAFVVIAAIILVIALVATFIYMWAKRRS